MIVVMTVTDMTIALVFRVQSHILREQGDWIPSV